MSLLDRITVNPEVAHGRPAVRGTRMRVTDVLSLLAEGADAAEILEDYPYLEADDIRACLAYAAAHADHPVLNASWAVRFLVDAQLPPALARLIVDLGHEAEHVFDIGPGDTTDRELWWYAIDNGAVIVTKDEDFSIMFPIDGAAPPVVWIRTPNTRKAALLAWFGPMLPRIVAEVEGGSGLVELR